MTEHCPACADAVLEPETGLVYVNCHGCNVRSVSRMPNFARLAVYATMPKDEQERFADQVGAEYRRLSEWRKVAR